MENLSRTSILKLAKRANVHSLSEDTYDVIRNVIIDKLNEVVDAMIIVNSERATKTIMSDDVYCALELLGHTLTKTRDSK